jgi:putative transposase
MPASLNRLFVHAVWGTWQREPWLVGNVRDIVYRTILAKCQESDAQVLALNGIEDHVHLLVQIPPTFAIVQLIGVIKGASSYIANHQGSDEVFKWQDGYGAFTGKPICHSNGDCLYQYPRGASYLFNVSHRHHA